MGRRNNGRLWERPIGAANGSTNETNHEPQRWPFVGEADWVRRMEGAAVTDPLEDSKITTNLAESGAALLGQA